MIFKYNIKKFTKIHLIRTFSLTAIYLFVFFFNYYRLNEAFKSDYLKLFIPITLILLFFLYRNYKKQLGILNGGYVELKGDSLKQFAHNGDFLEIDLKKVESIKQDKFRMFDRITIEDNEKLYSLINLNEPDKLRREIENRIASGH